MTRDIMEWIIAADCVADVLQCIVIYLQHMSQLLPGIIAATLSADSQLHRHRSLPAMSVLNCSCSSMLGHSCRI